MGDTTFAELLLTKAYEMCDTFQRLWDEQKTCDKHGFLTKRGGNIKSWKIRYFTLRGYELKYYDEPVATKCISSLDLSSCTKVFQDSTQNKPYCFGVVLPDRTSSMYAPGPAERAEWLHT